MRKHNNVKNIRETFGEYLQEGVFSKTLASEIVKAKCGDELIKSLSNYYNLSEELKSNIWIHIINKIWDKNDINTVFNEQNCIFIKCMLNNKGFLKRTDYKKIPVIKTDHRMTVCAENLSELGIIDIFQLNNREVIYLLNYMFFNEVLNDK
jgi:hypothetical protein